ncbi:hypothetical protein CP532_3201 [Ophiocordyceps camponoti-leonardi (nom. inval.)]|nr:hypothetical protein CP532_3201 [Ophiocordyceps camponoti-leonardi (nom. inval.)]
MSAVDDEQVWRDEQVRRAMLDDLGRSRLDVLPLSNREWNGSSFRPSRDGSERKFAPEFRVQLKSKWNNVSFEDEEARQMEGLANDDARPWAKKAIDVPVKSAPSRPAKSQAPPTKKQALPAKKQALPAKPPAKILPVKTPAKTLPAKPQPAKPSPTKSQPVKAQPVKAQPAKAQPSPTQTSKTQPSKSSSTKPPPSEPPSSEAQSHKVRRSKARRKRARKKAKRKQYELEAAQPTNPNEDVLCSGICHLSTSNGASEVRVVYALLIDIDADSAFLALTLPGGERKVHNVIDLETTVQHEDTCDIAARPGKGSYRYRLRLDERGRNVQLKRYLDALRKHVDVPPQRAVDAQPPQQVAEVQPPQQAEVQSSALLDLIDLDMGPPAASELPNEECGSASTVTDAADQLSEFLQRISRELAGCGPGSEDPEQGLEHRATDFWVRMGFMESEVDDLLASLRALTRVQKKVKLRQTANSRAGDAACEVPNTIRYSATELESLVGKAAPCPGVRDIVVPTMPANASGEKARLPSMSKCREWLLRSPSEAKSPSELGSVDPMEIGEFSICLVDKKKNVPDKSDTIPAPVLPSAAVVSQADTPSAELAGQSSQLPSPVGGPGLGASRWASK